MLNYISFAIIPIIIIGIVTFGFLNKVDVFDSFIIGGKEGIITSFKILPSLVALMVAISMLKASGFIDFLCYIISPVLNTIKFPKEILPLALMRPISGSGALAIIDDILKRFGADSVIGKTASIMAGSTETTFYTLAVYLGSVGIKNSRYTIKSALIADFTAMLASVYLVKLMY